MKQKIVRLSPHQNGKVFAVLMALGSLIFIVPFFAFFAAVAPAQARPPMLMLLVMPLVYLVLGYVTVALGCAVYNFMYQYIGGIEFDSEVDGA